MERDPRREAFHRTLMVWTRDTRCGHDLTDEVQRFVADCDVECGLVTALSLHTTAGLLLNERESGLQADFGEIADQLVPSAHAYRHDDMSVRSENLCPEDYEAPNGHSHIQHAMFGAPSVTLPVSDGQIVLGRWQRLLLVEYDRPRHRSVYLQMLATAGRSQHLSASTDELIASELSGR